MKMNLQVDYNPYKYPLGGKDYTTPPDLVVMVLFTLYVRRVRHVSYLWKMSNAKRPRKSEKWGKHVLRSDVMEASQMGWPVSHKGRSKSLLQIKELRIPDSKRETMTFRP